MEGTKYEMTYVIANYAKSATSEVEKVIAKLKEAGRPLTCKELGELVYGDAYKRVKEVVNGRIDFNAYHKNIDARVHTARINQVLQHMVRVGFVKVDEIKGEPYVYETTEVVWIDDENEPESIQVWDAKGNYYWINNPKYNYRSRHSEIRTIKHMGRKTIRTYEWVEE